MTDLIKRAGIKALEALENATGKREDQQDILFEDEKIYQMTVNVIRETKPKIITLPLPHSLYTGKVDICMIIGNKANKEEVEEYLEKHQVENVTILTETQLVKGYTQFDDKRKLRDSYDIFIGDKNIEPVLFKYLGKTFFDKLDKTPRILDVKNHLIQTIDKTTITKTGGKFTIKFAASHHEMQQMKENLNAVIDFVDHNIGLTNISSIIIKDQESPAIPIFNKVLNVPTKESKALLKKSKKATKSAVEEKSDEVEKKVPITKSPASKKPEINKTTLITKKQEVVAEVKPAAVVVVAEKKTVAEKKPVVVAEKKAAVVPVEEKKQVAVEKKTVAEKKPVVAEKKVVAAPVEEKKPVVAVEKKQVAVEKKAVASPVAVEKKVPITKSPASKKPEINKTTLNTKKQEAIAEVKPAVVEEKKPVVVEKKTVAEKKAVASPVAVEKKPVEKKSEVKPAVVAEKKPVVAVEKKVVSSPVVKKTVEVTKSTPKSKQVKKN